MLFFSENLSLLEEKFFTEELFSLLKDLKKLQSALLKNCLTFYSAKYADNILGFVPRWLTATTNDLFLHENLHVLQDSLYLMYIYCYIPLILFLSLFGLNPALWYSQWRNIPQKIKVELHSDQSGNRGLNCSKETLLPIPHSGKCL